MMKNKIIMFILIILLSSSALALFGRYEPPWRNDDVGWYDVEDWELAVCSTYGFQQSSDVSVVVSDVSNSGFIDTVAATVGAKKMLLPDGDYLYEFSWYLQPIVDEISYSVYLDYGKEVRREELLEQDSAGSITGNAGYETRQSSINYTKIRLETFGSSRYAGFTMEAPVVEVPYEEQI